MTISMEQRLRMRNPPSKTRIMYQEWRNLLFLHWKCDKEEIQKTLPKGLYVDTYNDEAYISIVPFFLQNLRARMLPSLPLLSDFIEVNVRTYVYDKNGIPGIWFYSLDINSLIATTLARKLFFLPYHNAKLTSMTTPEEIQISGNRNNIKKVNMSFNFLPFSRSKTFVADLPSLDFFLLERYASFSFNSNQLYIQQIHHSPYLLSNVELKEYKSNLLEANHLKSNQVHPELVHYCNGLGVDFFPLEKNL